MMSTQMLKIYIYPNMDNMDNKGNRKNTSLTALFVILLLFDYKILKN